MSRDKRGKFIELAEKRVSRALHDIRLIGNLANKSNYEYDSEDAARIVGALDDEVRRLKMSFNLARQENRIFKLKDDIE